MKVKVILNDDKCPCMIFENVLILERDSDSDFLYIYYEMMNKIIHSKVNGKSIKRIIIE